MRLALNGYWIILRRELLSTGWFKTTLAERWVAWIKWKQLEVGRWAMCAIVPEHEALSSSVDP